MKIQNFLNKIKYFTLFMSIILTLNKCTLLGKSFYSAPILKTKKENLILESRGKYDHTRNNVFQIKISNIIFAARLNNVVNEGWAMGAFCIPFIPLFKSKDGYGYNKKIDALNNDFIFLSLAFKYNAKYRLLFNPCEINIKKNNDGKILKPFQFDFYNSYNSRLKPTFQKKIFLRNNCLKNKEKNVVTFDNKKDTKTIVIKFYGDLNYKSKGKIIFPDILYQNKSISIPHFNFMEGSEIHYYPGVI